MDETEDPAIQKRLGDWLAYGEKVKPGGGNCAAHGFELDLEDTNASPSARSAATSSAKRAGGLTLGQASAEGLVEVDRFPHQTIVTTHSSQPVNLKLPGAAETLTATPLNGSKQGAPKTYALGSNPTVQTGAAKISVADASGNVAPTAKPHVNPPKTVALVHIAGRNATVSPRIDHGSAFLRRGTGKAHAWKAPVTVRTASLRRLAYAGTDQWGNAEATHYLRALATKHKHGALAVHLTCSKQELGPCVGRIHAGNKGAKYKLKPGHSKTLRLKGVGRRASVSVYNGRTLVEELMGH
jgi:hypothetical protein